MEKVVIVAGRRAGRSSAVIDAQNQEIQKLRARIAELEAERAELVKDRERLDWLETADNGGYHCDILWHAIDSGTLEPDQEQEPPTIRQAIDAAREGE